LIWKFKKQHSTVFVDRDSAVFEVDESVNVILSPSLYWVQKRTLPVKSLREVKPLIESLFEDILPDGHYSYSAYKEGDEYLLFAYQDKAILDILAQKGLPPSKVNAVYFAQNELASLQEPKKIDDENVIAIKEGIVILLPAKFIKTDALLDVNDLSLSKKSIALKQFGHIVNEKSLYRLIALLAVIIVLVGSEYIITLNKASRLQTQREELFSSYNLKPTMFQNKALLKKYEGIYASQTKLRTLLAAVLSMHLNPAERLKVVEYKNKKLKLAYMGVKEGEEGIIKEQLKKRGFVPVKEHFNSGIWYVEFQL